MCMTTRCARGTGAFNLRLKHAEGRRTSGNIAILLSEVQARIGTSIRMAGIRILIRNVAHTLMDILANRKQMQ